MYLVLLVFCTIFSPLTTHPSNGDQLYFPEETNSQTYNANAEPQIFKDRLTELREQNSTIYEQYVDVIISGGIAKLTLAINRAFLDVVSKRQSNLVFAPVSIGGALALVLLGSNGKTFQEITTVLGFASGLQNIKDRSEQVHEQFGRMIAKLELSAGFDIEQQVSFAHAVFVQKTYPIRKLYIQTARDLYESEIINLDFAHNPRLAQETMNKWVSDRTRGKITNIMADVPSQTTKVIIASAMYFKAQWEHPFFEGTTQRRPFYTNGRNAPSLIEVEMMANGGMFPYYRDSKLNCEVLGLPYKGNATVMYVVMPVDSDAEKLKQLETDVTAGDLKRLADNTVSTEAIILFPKMKIESTIDLRGPLQDLGLRSLFNPSEANLALLSPGENYMPSPIQNRNQGAINCSEIFSQNSRITTCHQYINTGNVTGEVTYKKINDKIGRKVAPRIGASNSEDSDTLDKLRELINQQSTDNNYQNPGLYADKVVHKVYMDITETGTEAAATTSITLTRDGSKVTFRADVPFFFFIRHEETKVIMFWGSVNQPTPHFRKDN